MNKSVRKIVKISYHVLAFKLYFLPIMFFKVESRTLICLLHLGFDENVLLSCLRKCDVGMLG